MNDLLSSTELSQLSPADLLRTVTGWQCLSQTVYEVPDLRGFAQKGVDLHRIDNVCPPEWQANLQAFSHNKPRDLHYHARVEGGAGACEVLFPIAGKGVILVGGRALQVKGPLSLAAINQYRSLSLAVYPGLDNDPRALLINYPFARDTKAVVGIRIPAGVMHDTLAEKTMLVLSVKTPTVAGVPISDQFVAETEWLQSICGTSLSYRPRANIVDCQRPRLPQVEIKRVFFTPKLSYRELYYPLVREAKFWAMVGCLNYTNNGGFEYELGADGCIIPQRLRGIGNPQDVQVGDLYVGNLYIDIGSQIYGRNYLVITGENRF